MSGLGHWWRAYDAAVDNAKLGKLSDALHRAWFNLCCVASANGGVLPDIDTVAFKLRVTAHKAAELITALVAARLFDRRGDGRFEPHEWNEKQYKSDVSTPRVKRFRERQRNGEDGDPGNVSEAPPESETDSDTERKKEGARARAVYSVEFEDEFWKPYPRTPVMSKAEAWKAWEKSSEQDRTAIVAAVPRYAAWLKSKPDHPAVHACRFITQRRFDGFSLSDSEAIDAITIAPDTPEWDAWWVYHGRHLNSAGVSFAQTCMRRAKADGKPHFERSQWPPGHSEITPLIAAADGLAERAAERMAGLRTEPGRDA